MFSIDRLTALVYTMDVKRKGGIVMYLMYDDDGSFIGIVKENPMAETYHDINWFLVEVPDLIFNNDTWEWEFTAPVRVEKKHDQT